MVLDYVEGGFRIPRVAGETHSALMAELEYFRVPHLPGVLMDEFNKMFSSDPSLEFPLGEVALQKWQTLGPLRVEGIFARSRYAPIRQIRASSQKRATVTDVG